MDVDPDVAHPVHGIPEDRDLEPAPTGDGCRDSRPLADCMLERREPPVVGDHVERTARPHHGVGRVLGTVDALVVGQIAHVPLGSDLRNRLHVEEADRKPRVGERPSDAHRRAVGEHDHQQPVDPLVLELADGVVDAVAILDGCRDVHVGDPRQRSAEIACIRLLALADPGQHLVVEALHDPEQSEPGTAPRHLRTNRRLSGRGRGVHLNLLSQAERAGV